MTDRPLAPAMPTPPRDGAPAAGAAVDAAASAAGDAAVSAVGGTAAGAGASLDGLDEVDVLAASPALPTSGPEAVSFLGVLRRRDFRLLWLAQTAAQLADKFLVYTLLIVVFTLTGRSSTQSLVMLAYTLPSVLLSAAAGVYADRHDKRALMIWTSLLRGALLLLIPVILATPALGGNALPLLVVTLAFSAAGQFFAPAEAASIPFLVDRDQIMLATSLFMTTVVGTLVAGVPVATVLIRLVGDRAPFYVAAGLFATAAGCVVAMRTSLRAAVRRPAHARHLGAELHEGVAILAADPVLRFGLVQLTVSLVVVFTMFALGPAYMTRVLGSRPEDTYQLLMPATGGLVLAAVVLGRRGRSLSRATAAWTAAVLAGGLLVCTSYLPGQLVIHAGLAVAPAVIALSFGFGAALGAILIVAFTVLQESTDEASRGRIFGGIFTVMNAAVALPLLLAGQLADSLGVEVVVLGLGVALAGWGLACRVLLGSSLRRLDAPARSA